MSERDKRSSSSSGARRGMNLSGLTLVRVIGIGILIAGAALIADRYGPRLETIVEHFFDYGIIMLMSVVLSALIIDVLNEQRIRRDRKQAIIQQMGSPVQGMALEAARLASLAGWLEDGSVSAAGLLYANLQGARLGKANLQSAELTGANLQGAWLMGANLQGATLAGANLHGAVLMGINLQGAALIEANLDGAAMIEANLQGADLHKASLTGAELTRAKFDGATRLPDGSKWSKGTDLTRFTNAGHPDYWRPPKEEEEQAREEQ